MQLTIKNGLSSDGIIHGKLNLDKRAKKLYEKR